MNEVEDSRGEGGLPAVAILFTHFAPYHIDRIEAATARLKGRARILGVECASAEDTYDWEARRATREAEYLTLFPGRKYEDIGRLERLTAYAGAMRHCDLVLSGIPWSEPDIVALSWRWRARGRRIVAMTDSKFDDRPRNLVAEQVKARLLAGFSGAMVSGLRQRDYLRFLGFEDKPVLPGYGTLSVDRIEQQAGDEATDWSERPFVYAGRLVPKKNLATLLAGYARYAEEAGQNARRLVMVGDGEQRSELENHAVALGVGENVDFIGWHDSFGVSRQLARALALCLVSVEEQWGLVVNEAIALGTPAIVSHNVGARDALVRGGINGHVVEAGSPASIARAMAAVASNEAAWLDMQEAALSRRWMADSERFAEAVEMLVDPAAGPSDNIERFWHECEQWH